jgi:hypothetical protein
MLPNHTLVRLANDNISDRNAVTDTNLSSMIKALELLVKSGKVEWHDRLQACYNERDKRKGASA